jgi:hypothetical protein
MNIEKSLRNQGGGGLEQQHLSRGKIIISNGSKTEWGKIH